MIDLHLHGLHIHSSLGLVGLHGKNWTSDSATLNAEQLPDLAALLDGSDPNLNFDPLEFQLSVCGVTFRKQSHMAEVLAGVLRAARFASGGSIDAVLADTRHWDAQVLAVKLGLQERHMRTRLARLLGVQAEALGDFTCGETRHTRSGETAVLRGTLLGAEMQFTLEYEHLLVYAGTLPGRKVVALGDVTATAGLAGTAAPRGWDQVSA